MENLDISSPQSEARMSAHSDDASAQLHVGRDMTGQAVVGSNNRVTWQQAQQGAPVTAADLAEIRQVIDELRGLVDAEIDVEATAREKLDELEEALTAERPDLATLEHVRGWFGRRLPRLADAVGRVILSPLVAKLIGAAGDELAVEFTRRFGS